MDAADIDRLRASHDLAGEEVHSDAREPLWITGSADVWIVLAGTVDLFHVEAAGHGAGRRHHLLRLFPGAAMFGSRAGLADPTAEDMPGGLLAVGHDGCRLLRLHDGCARTGERGALAALIDTWVAALATAMAGPHRPARFESARSGEMRELAPRTTLLGDPIVWMRVVAGACRPIGLDEYSRDAGSPPFPLTPALWVDCAAASSLALDATADVVASGHAWLALAELQRAAVGIFGRAALAGRQAEIAAAARQERLDDAAIGRALARVGRALERDATQGAYAPRTDDPLVLACAHIAEALGVALRVPQELDEGAAPSDRVAAIAAASGMRFRRVRLGKGWWTGGAGPLLCFGAADGVAYVALPNDAGHYQLIDSVHARRETISAASAELLLPNAFAFYRGFPSRRVGWRDMLRILADMNRPDLRRLTWAGIASALLGLAIPVASDVIISDAIPFSDTPGLAVLTVGMLLAACGAAAFNAVRAVAIARMEIRSDTVLQSAVWDRLLRLPATFFRGYTAGDLADRAMGVSSMRQIVTDVTLAAALTGIFSLVNILLIFAYDARLGAVAVLVTLLTAVPIVLCARIQLRHIRTFFRLRGRINGIVLQFLRGIAKLRACHAERRAFTIWAEEFAVQRHANVQGGAAINLAQTIGAGLPALAAITLFATVAYVRSDLTVGSFVAVTTAFTQFLVAAVGVIGAIANSLVVVPLYERLKPILDAEPEIAEGGEDPGRLRGRIDVARLSFSYDKDGPPALQDVSLYVEPGEFIALVGASGSGKSTLLRLLLGFEQPHVGSIRYDDRDLARLDKRAVRRQMGVVVQNAALLPGDIFTNIVGSANLSLEDAWEAARMAGLDQDIRAMPMRMHTVIGEGMSTMSGGQRQRLLIARALAHRPRMILFDEATSALDNRTQAIVTESLEALRATRVVIAHRLTTVRRADRIYVLAGGRVVESGRFEELMTLDGHFAALAHRQLA